ncbi:hypothetical protein N9L19_00370 [bacterium]|nr:hypothetical protein [bacterium]
MFDKDGRDITTEIQRQDPGEQFLQAFSIARDAAKAALVEADTTGGASSAMTPPPVPALDLTAAVTARSSAFLVDRLRADESDAADEPDAAEPTPDGIDREDKEQYLASVVVDDQAPPQDAPSEPADAEEAIFEVTSEVSASEEEPPVPVTALAESSFAVDLEADGQDDDADL